MRNLHLNAEDLRMKLQDVFKNNVSKMKWRLTEKGEGFINKKTTEFGVIDTVAGTIINWPLNVLLFWAVAQYNIGPVMAATAATVFFFVIAIVRKGILAYHMFEKKSEEPDDLYMKPEDWA
jgi:hypothetical protein